MTFAYSEWCYLANDEHAVYRMHGADGSLLYVGMSRHPMARFLGHSQTQPWFREVASISWQILPTRDAAIDAEGRAIRAEAPRYNVAHNRQVPAPRKAPCAATKTNGAPCRGYATTGADVCAYHLQETAA